MMVECFENFESTNINILPSSNVNTLKETMKNKFLILPSLIPNNLMSQSLQEFVIRCLKRIYKTKSSPDSTDKINRLDNVGNLV